MTSPRRLCPLRRADVAVEGGVFVRHGSAAATCSGSGQVAEAIPDPFPVASLLRSAVEAHCARTGCTMADVARAAWPGSTGASAMLHRALREGGRRETQPATVRAVCRAIGLRVALVPA